MNQPKHTPGPWEYGIGCVAGIGEVFGVGIASEPDWTPICLLSPPEKVSETDEANARLIAAAPELLEALKRCLEIMQNGGTWTLEDQNAAHAAIAKAERGSNE